MPTENEVKLVVSLDCEKEVYEQSLRVDNLSQGYLTPDGSVRLRRAPMQPHILTYKKWVGSRLVEIETEVNDKDFHDLWFHATGKLTKVRYTLPRIAMFEDWTVDFIIGTGNKPVLALAEVELLLEGFQSYLLPEVIKNNIVYIVPQGDNRFMNSKFGDAQYVEELAGEIYGR